MHVLTTMLTNELIRHEAISLPYTFERADSIFALLIICFFLIAYVYKGGMAHFRENLALIISLDKNVRQHKEATTKDSWYNYLLVLQTIILISICVYDTFFLYCDKVDTGGSVRDYTSLLTIVSYVAIFILFLFLKYIMNVSIGYAFDDKKIADIWKRSNMTAIEILGVIYFIPTLLLVYSNHWHPQIIGSMLIIFLIVKLILYYGVIIYFIREKFNYLFLFAYLCSLEIIPYLFLTLGLYLVYKIDVYNLILCL